MGVRKYCNKYRAYVVAKDGQHYQRYFDSRKDAQDFIHTFHPPVDGNSKYKKRSTAINQLLPVGLHECSYAKTLTDGTESRYYAIKASVMVNGKAKTKLLTYNETLRTKEQAIKECHKWRKAELKKMRVKK